MNVRAQMIDRLTTAMSDENELSNKNIAALCKVVDCLRENPAFGERFLQLLGHIHLNVDATPEPTVPEEMQFDEARALHRIVRSMHDGHCPKCGHLGSAEMFRRDHLGTHECPKCGFYIRDSHAEKAMQEFKPFLQRSLVIFELWRDKQE